MSWLLNFSCCFKSIKRKKVKKNKETVVMPSVKNHESVKHDVSKNSSDKVTKDLDSAVEVIKSKNTSDDSNKIRPSRLSLGIKDDSSHKSVLSPKNKLEVSDDSLTSIDDSSKGRRIFSPMFRGRYRANTIDSQNYSKPSSKASSLTKVELEACLKREINTKNMSKTIPIPIIGEVNQEEKLIWDLDSDGNKFLRLYYNFKTTSAHEVQRRIEEFRLPSGPSSN